MTPDRPAVLLVRDEPSISATRSLLPSDQYEIRTASTTSGAVQQLDGVDVILIDRALSEADADDVLDALRERGADYRAAMLTEHTPDFDVVETGFDDYVTKPLTRSALRETVDDLIGHEEYAMQVEEYHDLLSKQAAMEAEKSESELTACEEYAAIESRIEDLRTSLEAVNDRLLDDTEFVGTLREVTGEPDMDTTEEI